MFFRIHDNNLEILYNNKWVRDKLTKLYEIFNANDIKVSWRPEYGDIVYLIDFTIDNSCATLVYDSDTKSTIDTLFSFGLIFETEEDAIKELKRRQCN